MPLCSSPSRRPPHQVHVAAVLRLPRQPPDPVLRPGAHPRPIARTTLQPPLLGPTRELLPLLHDATIGCGTEAPSAELPRVRPSEPGGGGGVLHGTAGAVRELADLLRHMVSGKMCGGLEWRRTTRGSRQTKTRGATPFWRCWTYLSPPADTHPGHIDFLCIMACRRLGRLSPHPGVCRRLRTLGDGQPHGLRHRTRARGHHGSGRLCGA